MQYFGDNYFCISFIKKLQRFIEELEITNVTRILDFGCGTGNYANTLQRRTQAQDLRS